MGIKKKKAKVFRDSFPIFAYLQLKSLGKSQISMATDLQNDLNTERKLADWLTVTSFLGDPGWVTGAALPEMRCAPEAHQVCQDVWTGGGQAPQCPR